MDGSAPEGKPTISRNALKQGKSAKKYSHFVPCSTTILSNEDRHEFARIFQNLCDQLAPHTELELDYVHRIADSEWRLSRWEYIESALFEAEFQSFPEALFERFQFLRDAARNRNAEAPDAKLFVQLRHQQMFYVRLRKHHMDEYCRLRREFPARSRHIQPPDSHLFGHENQPSSSPEPSRKQPGTAPDSSRDQPDSTPAWNSLKQA